VSEAIFGLVGVVVGGLLTGGMEFLHNRLEQRTDVREAARLLHIDLITIENALEQVAKGEWPPDAEWTRRAVQVPEVWPQVRSPLARSLKSGEFNALAFVIWSLKRMEVRDTIAAEEYAHVQDKMGEAMEAIRKLA
jgi:hypothetical protein